MPNNHPPPSNPTRHAWHIPRALVFLAVAEHGSITAAAKALSLSKGVVSVHLKQLEEACGARLFERSTRRVVLTQSGATFLPYAEAIRQAWQDGLAVLEGEREEPRGTLVVTAPSLLEAPLLNPVVGEYLRRYQRVRIDLRLTDTMLDIIKHGIDVALRTGPLPDSDLISRLLMRDHEIIVGAPVLLEGRPSPGVPEQLMTWPWIGHRGLSTHRDLMATDGRQMTLEFEPRVVVDTATALKNLLLRGAGLALVPKLAVREELLAGALVNVLPRWSAPEMAIHAVIPSKRHMAPRVSRFVDLLVEQGRSNA